MNWRRGKQEIPWEVSFFRLPIDEGFPSEPEFIVINPLASAAQRPSLPLVHLFHPAAHIEFLVVLLVVITQP